MQSVTETQKQLIRNQIRCEIHKRSFFEFVKWVAVLLEPSTSWKWNFHHQYLCDLLQDETHRILEGKEKTKDIIINVPFRSSKSLICSICYPIWSWMINPDMTFINLSYSDNLSTDHSNKVVSIIMNPKFQELYHWEFDEVQRSKTDFKLKNCGAQRLSGGMGGTVLGRGSSAIIMDDPNNTKRLSAVERHNTIKNWKDTISTRLNNPETGLFIVIQQRLHTEDLSGYLMANEPENWRNVCLPAELGANINPPELAEHYVDGLLWGDRFNRKVLDNFKLVLGSIGYANQLNQLTMPEEGVIIKRDWIKIITNEKFNELLEINRVRAKWDMFLDTAYTAKQSNDPSAILIACKILNNVYVRKAIQVHLEFPDLIKKIKNVGDLYLSSQSRIFVEPKASGLDVVNTLKRESNLNVVKLESPRDDKETRLNAVSPFIEGGRLILIEDISNDLVIDELIGFPQTKHDDVLDTVVYALKKYVKETELNYIM